MRNNGPITGVEKFFSHDEFIVSKTDLKGIITYANKVFIDISEFREEELLGEAHSIIRHPFMPRCVFKLLWDTVEDGREIFAYVLNRTKHGNEYWVFAHITPSFDNKGNITGYHSNRRVPNKETLDNVIIPLYDALLKIEEKYNFSKEGMDKSYQKLIEILKEKNTTYNKFILSI